MCGFVALLSLTDRRPDESCVKRMTDVIAHRGPDDDGYFAENGIGIGFRRLSILDVAPSGHQPMLSGDGRHVIVFNGAIYNYIELRHELESFGHVFKSTGDTEVLLTAYKEWGQDCLYRLNGMWAFIIYDRLERTLFGARDRFGEKPLYWRRTSDSLIFASEIKALRDPNGPKLDFNPQAIDDYLLQDALDTSEQTFYRDVFQVRAGTAFKCDAKGSISWLRYWHLDVAAAATPLPTDPAASYAELFGDAVRLRMRSDVPLGVQLSGGLDSTSIISFVAKEQNAHPDAGRLSAFCYLDPQFDESQYIEPTLAQTKAQQEVFHADAHLIWNTLLRHLWYHDEPVQSMTSVVGYHLMALARSRGLKVILSGQGADEVLAGYPTYFKYHWADLLRTGRWWTFAHALHARAQLTTWQSALELGTSSAKLLAHQLLRRHRGIDAMASERNVQALRQDPWASDDVKQRWQAQESKLPKSLPNSLYDALRASVETKSLPLYLRVEDRNSMAHGVEARLPFLDHRLVALTFRLGSEWKLRGVYSKWVLREAMRGRIPENVRMRVQKFGFPTNAERWFRSELYEPLRDVISSQAVRESGLWNMTRLEQDLERHRRGEINVGNRLFDVAQLGLILRGLPAPSKVGTAVKSWITAIHTTVFMWIVGLEELTPLLEFA